MLRAASLLAGSLVWLVGFFLVPLAYLLTVSFAHRSPYGTIEWTFGLGNYSRAFQPLYLEIYWRSFWMALVTTSVCAVLGYPVAYTIALRASPRLRSTLLNTPSAVFIGLVYGELPFMILPIYAVLQKFDRSLLEAAQDLGAGRWRTFFRVTLPLSAPGFAAGAVLVFISSVGAFITPDLLGGARTMMVGNLIQNQFALVRDQPFGSAVAFLLTAVVLLMLLTGLRRAQRVTREMF
ncbi:MAG: spermidine/putrescine ABC transporter permease [Acidobacteria bacterium]|nr:MAG: spermidine/putrescine ABC transporter permease [Acidobacteriota bacterium]